MATVSPPWTYALRLPHDPRAPGIARCTLRAVLRTHGVGAGLADTAELLASELVTNAHLHSGGPYTLRIRAAGPQGLRLSVWDTSPDIPSPFNGSLPALPTPERLAESGRGAADRAALRRQLGGVSAG
ncbi:ATP-binding protein [Streptomyces sp. 21So2-11]|uniref:ATP-binding protein n=1 Tax=Streptomyces sp. 21So2-11 TaxID=3144408 RepID=UPI00321B819B